MKVVLNWSSGKDAALAYYHLLQNSNYRVVKLLTTVNLEHGRVVMHGVREQLLDAQSKQMNVPVKKIYLPASPDDVTYKTAMQLALEELQKEDIAISAFGDIFLEDLRAYREQQLATLGMTALFPLWKKDTRGMVGELEDIGIEAMVVCVNAKYLDESFLGRKVDRQFLADLPANVDPCGENGEFHTFVYNAPFFDTPIAVSKGESVYREYGEGELRSGFYFLDIDV
ncbi:diphthine--ammonia ligase [Polluticoccus soli]|uniref:Dph6-related ATP pyrophosphatase n=1 Tax=Polluticoccus soli TaxID=3034150 RepID=UPI0023E23944|nr:diphthine--ammonia ligase [Flavipsychrobacter sp. JY13-12]